MALVWTILSDVGVAAAAVLVYEVIHSSVRRHPRKRFHRGLVTFLRGAPCGNASVLFTLKMEATWAGHKTTIEASPASRPLDARASTARWQATTPGGP